MNVREVKFWKITTQKTDKMDSGKSLRRLLGLVAMTGDIQIAPTLKITSALALVHALCTAGKPVRDDDAVIHQYMGV